MRHGTARSVLPCTVVFDLLDDSKLDVVESDGSRSSYRYRCGCSVVRAAESSVCATAPCVQHRARLATADLRIS